MKFEYTGRHLDVTPAIRRHVEEHFQTIDHIFQDSSTASAQRATPRARYRPWTTRLRRLGTWRPGPMSMR